VFLGAVGEAYQVDAQIVVFTQDDATIAFPPEPFFGAATSGTSML
jgi:hypothetical protein